MDSLSNSYSIYFPSGVPSVSFPLLLLNFLNSLFHSHSAFLRSPLPPSSTPLPLFFSGPSLSVPRCHLPALTKNLTLVLPLLSVCVSSRLVLFLFFSHLVQCGLADWEVFDLQSIFVGLQLVEDVSHPSRSNWYVVLHHRGVLVLCVGKERTSTGLNILKLYARYVTKILCITL